MGLNVHSRFRERTHVLLIIIIDKQSGEQITEFVGSQVRADSRACALSPNPYCFSAAAAAKLLQSCPTPCDPIDGSPPGSAIPGILQARVPGWGAIAFSGVSLTSVK